MIIFTSQFTGKNIKNEKNLLQQAFPDRSSLLESIPFVLEIKTSQKTSQAVQTDLNIICLIMNFSQ